MQMRLPHLIAAVVAQRCGEMIMKKAIATSLVVWLTVSGGLVLGSMQQTCFAGNDASVASPKPLNENVVKGLAYLVSQQETNGGWSQGEESKYMHSVGEVNKDIPNVADTCMAGLALVRAGNCPNAGPYAKNVAAAVDFVCKSIEKADRDSLFITEIRGIRVQQKLGQYVDTFLASVFLPEVKGRMPNPIDNERVTAALDRVIRKIERNQDKDGGFASGGWAPVHSQSLAMQGLNKAKQVGANVSDEALARADGYATRSYDHRTGSFSSAGSAGVQLYAAGATLGSLQSSVDTFNTKKAELEKIATSTSAPKEDRDKANSQLKHYEEVQQNQQLALGSVAKRLGDQGFVQGFGCNGGEEFLSYLQISQTLVTNHSKEWPDWDKKITNNIDHVQSSDGSWMGQHCITSRTFCTAAALMVLTADRSAITPVANGNQKGRTVSTAAK